MSTRASIVFRDNFGTSYVYRHSDGYPETTGKDLKDFVKDYSKGALRLNVDQSMGWLIVRGHFEYKRDDRLQFDESDISGLNQVKKINIAVGRSELMSQRRPCMATRSTYTSSTLRHAR